MRRPARLACAVVVRLCDRVVAGTRRAMAKGSFRFQRARARVKVLDPIETKGLTLDDVGALRDKVRALIEDAHTRLLRELEGGEPA